MLSARTISDLKKELEVIGHERDALRERQSAIELLLRHATLQPQPIATRSTSTCVTKRVADAAYRVIGDSNRPIRRETILEAIEASGVTVNGSNLPKRLAGLSAVFSRDARFKSMGKGTGLWDIDRDHTARTERVDQSEGQNGHSPGSPIPLTQPVTPP